LLWPGHSQKDLECLRRLREQQVPYVILAAHSIDGDTSSIAVDYEAGMEQAVEHLVRRGLCEMGYVGTDVVPSPWRHSKYHALLEAIRRRGLRPGPCFRLPVPDPWPRDIWGYSCQLGRELAASPPLPRVLFFESDLLALGAMRGLHDGGVRVPADVAVIGFDNIPEGMIGIPGLTTVAQPVEELVRHGLATLLRLMEEPDSEPTRLFLKPRLIVRESCGAPPELRALPAGAVAEENQAPGGSHQVLERCEPPAAITGSSSIGNPGESPYRARAHC
jgi:LacI family transcriptional regulator